MTPICIKCGAPLDRLRREEACSVCFECMEAQLRQNACERVDYMCGCSIRDGGDLEEYPT